MVMDEGGMQQEPNTIVQCKINVLALVLVTNMITVFKSKAWIRQAMQRWLNNQSTLLIPVLQIVKWN